MLKRKIRNWMNLSFLKLNPNKTVVKLFEPKYPKSDSRISSLGLQIDKETTVFSTDIVKILGVKLGLRLNFEEFIASKIRTCNMHLKNLINIKYCLPQKTRTLLVNNLILSTLDYANSLLLCLPNYRIQALQKVMNKGIRFIFNLKYDDHISPYLYKLHFLPVKFRLKFKTCLLAYKIVNEIAPEYLQEQFIKFEPTSKTILRPGIGRDKLMLEINLTKIKKNILNSRLIVEWNQLPLKLRSIPEINNFKSRLKAHYFRIAFADFS